MLWSDISTSPSTRTLRQFAGAWLVFFFALAGWLAWREGIALPVFGCSLLALAVGITGIFRPQTVRWIYVMASMLTFPIGWMISRILLGIFFFAIITPLALWFRLVGRDALLLERKPNTESYWSAKCDAPDVQGYFRQF